MWPLQLIIAAVCGVIAAAIASHKGRNVAGWFFGGFFLGIVGIVIVAVLPNLKEQKASRERAESERRRLREQLRQERAKGEAYRRYSMGRLDAHDEALGMDTRSRPALPADEQAAALQYLTDAQQPAAQSKAGETESALHRLAQEGGPGAPPPSPGSRVWYYEIQGVPVGPLPETEIRGLLRSRKIGPGTLLWSEDLGQWTPAGQVATFRSAENP